MRFVERFLAEYGNRLKQIRVDQPTLESGFLSLAGRELRDEGASACDRTYTFGKRGGEHTKWRVYGAIWSDCTQSGYVK